MGTRGLVGVVIDDTPKATYNHFDSYPTGLGLDVVKFVQGLDWENLDADREAFQNLTLVDESENPTDEQIDVLNARGIDSPVAVSTGVDWYAWLREAQGNLSEYLRIGFMPNGTTFGSDSLFCEWGYLVNLDNQTVEVYRGFQTEPHTEGYWSDVPTQNGYHGIKRIAVIPFADLSDEVMTKIETDVYGEEDDD